MKLVTRGIPLYKARHVNVLQKWDEAVVLKPTIGTHISHNHVFANTAAPKLDRNASAAEKAQRNLFGLLNSLKRSWIRYSQTVNNQASETDHLTRHISVADSIEIDCGPNNGIKTMTIHTQMATSRVSKRVEA